MSERQTFFSRSAAFSAKIVPAQQIYKRLSLWYNEIHCIHA